MQETASNKDQYMKNKAILKIDKNDQYAKAIALAKSPRKFKD